jgi:hypothetical protein
MFKDGTEPISASKRVDMDSLKGESQKEMSVARTVLGLRARPSRKGVRRGVGEPGECEKGRGSWDDGRQESIKKRIHKIGQDEWQRLWLKSI